MFDVLGEVFEVLDEVGVDREDVVFVYLFGSYVDGSESAEDIDICISVDSEVDSSKLEQKVQGRVPVKYDISVFENLPLQVKKQVFAGELLYSRDKSVYDAAFKTFKEFQSFKRFYREAIGI